MFVFFTLLFQSLQKLAHGLVLRLELVLVQLEQHFVLHGVFILRGQFLVFLFVVEMETLQLLNLLDEFFFLLLDSLVVDFMEVPFFPQLLPSELGFVCEYLRLVQLLLLLGNLVK